VALWVHSIARWIGITKNSKSASKAFAKLLSEKAFSAVRRQPSSKSAFPLSNGAGEYRPTVITGRQLGATFIDDSGNSDVDDRRYSRTEPSRYFVPLKVEPISGNSTEDVTMTAPENHTLRLLQDIRGAIGTLDSRVDSLDKKVDRNHDDLKERIENLRQAAFGESVLGRYAAAEVEERLSAIESRLSALEQHK
jgi:hypothetical protein